MNCPRCNMLLAHGAQTCPNCHLNLQQYMYQHQQPGPMYGAPLATGESPKEKVYRKLLIVIAIVLMSEFVVAQLPIFMGFYSLSTIVQWLDVLIWAGVPLIIGLVLPKNSQGRIVMIVFASIYILLRVLYAYWLQNMWYGSFFYDNYF